MLKMVNNALGLAWDAAILSQPELAPYTAADAPYFKLNENTNKIEIVLPADNTQNPASPFFPFNADGITIYMNKKLFSMFSGFRAKFFPNGVAGSPDANYKLQFEVGQTNFETLPAMAPDLAREVNIVSQDTSSLYAMNQISRIFITTTMEIVQEDIAIKGAGNRQVRQKMLQDWEIPPPISGNLREYIYFFGGDDVRFHNFMASGDLIRFDYKCYVQLNNLETLPVNIPAGFEMSLKLVLKRRKNQKDLQYSIKNDMVQ
jgi:hypothetical protein